MYKIECLHMLGTPESERLKVTALDLFHPTVSPLFEKLIFLYCDTVSEGEREGVRRKIEGGSRNKSELSGDLVLAIFKDLDRPF